MMCFLLVAYLMRMRIQFIRLLHFYFPFYFDLGRGAGGVDSFCFGFLIQFGFDYYYC